ncbi:hypothetical protein [Bacillus sp. FJAT-45350]|uniref:hypothetical protein n=1 Tax=Bacillus sp. FJAT-45350 TaxID=2011014 RepID=UPI0011550F06|nr:hypothetical protein [Bacillus sp. FJAT-45350]
MEESIYNERRVMFGRKPGIKQTYTYYSLKGEILARGREQITFGQMLTRLLYNLVHVANVLPQQFDFVIGDEHYIISKHGGIKKGFGVFDSHGTLLSYYKREKSWTKNMLHIYGKDDELIAVVNATTVGEVTVTDRNNDFLLFIRIGGIPTEALERFSNFHGDIIDINREKVDKELLTKIIATPIVTTYLESHDGLFF